MFYSAGKSTTLAILAGLTRASAGSLVFEGNTSRPSRGTLGIVPQKNVLFPELSCLQTLRVWQAVKAMSESESNEDLEKLILDCDLQSKIHEPAGTLSGGQKRKLQLAIGLVGGSKSMHFHFLRGVPLTHRVISNFS
jgi:ABC-type multidrug transport system ATPase subunit